jgi:cytochrome c oxidase cbb3-type subunit I
MNATCSPSPSAAGTDSISLAEIDASCRVPSFVLFAHAAFWLVASSVFGLIASIKFHSPNFLADCAWLTYGRVYPAATNALLYGFAIQAGLGVGLWIIARTGLVRVVQPWIIAFGGLLWNFGVLVGTFGILTGDSTGHENLELPKYAVAILALGYLLIGVCTLLTLHARTHRQLEPAQWFLLAALFWIPWILSTAELLLVISPVRGVTQSVIGWWYSANLKLVWLGLVGLAASFYFLAKLTNRALHSQYLALFTFWTIILFASWSGIPGSAPLPAWMPALSTIATVLTLITVLTVAVNVYQTVGKGCSQTNNPPPGKFIAFGVMAFAAAWLMNVVGTLRELTPFTHFTWFTTAQSHLNVYGFFAMTMIGAIYYIVPQVAGLKWCSSKLVKANYWIMALGILLFAIPLAIAGVVQGIKLNNPQIAFIDVAKSTLPFLRASTMGELLILVGNLILLGNLTALLIRYARTHFAPVCVDAVAELKPTEVKS